jgi:flagellar hook-basal body complex protein FliE
MTINPLTPDLIHLLSPGEANTTKGRVSGDTASNFENILSDAFRDVAETDAADKLSSLQLLTGGADDFSGLLIDIQKAEISLNLALQLRNKVVDAYNEIMRMQV